jgi:hypothetical protein
MPVRAAPDRDRIDRAIHHASWLGAFAMFAYGAALSFDVLHSIASAAGLSPVLVWRWPLGFETFMAVAAVAVLAEQRTRPHKTPWYPWVLTALAAGSSIALNFGHPYIPLDPPPRLLVACVYGVPPVTAPFARHLFLLRLAHRRQDDSQDRDDAGQHTQDSSQDAGVPARLQDEPAAVVAAAGASSASNGQGQRAVPRPGPAHRRDPGPAGVLAGRSRPDRAQPLRAYALLREERARLAAGNGHQPTLDLAYKTP